MSQNNTPSDTEEEFKPFWEIQLDDGEGNDGFEDEHFETREEAVKFLKENFAEEIKNPDIEINLYYHKYASGGDCETYEEEEEEEEDFAEEILKRQLMKKRLEEEEDKNWEGRGGGICMRKVINCDP